jgi:wobble nucleotide-excising tRNase
LESAVPDKHLDKLEGHFNNEYNQFVSDIEAFNKNTEGMIDSANNLTLPNKAQLYDDLQEEYESKCDIFEEEKREYVGHLQLLLQKIAEKKRAVFKVIRLEERIDLPIETTIDELNDVIKRHNDKSDNFTEEVKKARMKLENSCVAEALVEVLEKENRIGSLRKESKKINDDLGKIKTIIDELERDIIEHRRPADELNRDLIAYLGMNELQFEIKENGYQITRNGVTADAISEGEKTAIAFLYFLKSIKDKNFDLLEGIVVIDDPISSLDANSLFYAFGFMKERTKEVGQLFIFTHNFCFFRQVKNWFNYINKYKNKSHKEAGFYMLQCKGDGGTRYAEITTLDRLLFYYDSEYHYLYSLVYKGANSKSGGLEPY